MNQWYVVLNAVVAVFACIGVGAGARRLNVLSEEADKSLLRLVVNVLMPCLIFKSIVGNSALHDWHNIVLPPLLGAGLTVLGFVAALAWARGLGKAAGLADRPSRRTFALTVGLFNYGYIPVPLCEILYGKQTLGVLLLFGMGVEITMWTAGVMLLSPHGIGKTIRKAINAPSITIVASVALNLLHGDAAMPPFVMGAAEMLGRSAIPMSLILVGATVADYFLSASFRQGMGTIASACFLRLGLLPAIFIAVAVFAPMSDDLRRTLLIEAAMPAGMFPIVLARMYGGDTPTALRVVLGTSLAALGTIPAWLALGRVWIK